MVKTEYASALPYTTQNGVLIRELMHPDRHGNHDASLVEEVVAPLEQSSLHKHEKSDEIYHFTEGRGAMRVGDRVFPVQPRDTVFIPKGTDHQVQNSGECFLRVLCFSVPAGRHEDTVTL
jgi:mannose-6-phosphate isomerase-like protein (cupin superfamily)